MKISNNLTIQEVVHPETYAKYGSASQWFIDYRLPLIFEEMRKDLGPLFANTWSLSKPDIFGQVYRDRGYRRPESTTGAKESQHRSGRALDVSSVKYNASELRQYVRDNFKKLNALGLTTIEKDTPGWLHFDLRWTGFNYLFEVPFQ